MKVLVLDIETSPNLAHVWGIWKENISIAQLREHTKVIAFAAKWHGNVGEPMFHSDHHDGHEQMINEAHHLIDEADVVVHYNGRKFDMPHLNREFLLAEMTPPSPLLEVDLLEVVRSQFNFVSNKLDYVCQQLGIGTKTSHEGHELWVKCMAGDADAWERMKEYNKQDVVLTEKLYDRLRPWIKGHPHHGLTGDTPEACPNCGGPNLAPQGYALTALSKFPRYQCNDCGRWCRGKKAVATVDIRGIA